MNKKVITVFGSSLPKPGEPDYEDARRIGFMLGKSGFNLCTGGNRGIMEAVSKGAKEAGAEVIGITVTHFSTSPNEYVTTHIACETLFQRIEKLIEVASGFVVLRGGTGTLLELAAIWEFMNKQLIAPRPVVCLSDMWKLISTVMEEQIVSEGRKTGLVSICNTVDECVGKLQESLS
ncbi:MAG: LOG family protein [Ignavibacteriales bacterium]|nr:LOG family protein [Ignavibacteriales bacterium]